MGVGRGLVIPLQFLLKVQVAEERKGEDGGRRTNQHLQTNTKSRCWDEQLSGSSMFQDPEVDCGSLLEYVL